MLGIGEESTTETSGKDSSGKESVKLFMEIIRTDFFLKAKHITEESTGWSMKSQTEERNMGSLGNKRCLCLPCQVTAESFGAYFGL